MADDERGGFLPPEPAGPEPELGGRPAAPQPPPAPGPQAPHAQPGYAPAPGQGAPPPQAPAQPPPGGYPPPPGGWQPYPPGQSQQPAYQPGWGYAPQQQVPDNGPAVAGFVLSLVSLGLLLFSAGLSSLVSLGCAIAGVVLGRRGIKRVEAGETPKHKGLAQAGFWIGIGALVLSAIATAFWILILVLAITSEEFRDDIENDFDDSQSIRLAVGAIRLGLHLLA